MINQKVSGNSSKTRWLLATLLSACPALRADTMSLTGLECLDSVLAVFGVLFTVKVAVNLLWNVLKALRVFVWARLWNKRLTRTYGRWAGESGNIFTSHFNRSKILSILWIHSTTLHSKYIASYNNTTNPVKHHTRFWKLFINGSISGVSRCSLHPFF